MLIFSILACACAVLFAVMLDMSSGSEGEKTLLAQIIQRVGLLIVVLACGAIQYWKMTQGGATGSRLWWAVTGTAIGAPIAGIVLMLIVTFAIYGKTP